MARRVPGAVILALAVVAARGPGAPVVADGPAAPPHPFSVLPEQIRLGRTVRLPGLTLLSLRLEEDRQPGLPAKVGLRDASVHVLALPAPAGEMHVRIANRGPLPLEIPPGETLLSPVGPSRSVDRTVWIPPGGAAFVPVVHADALPPPGPYVSRGLGLSPFELQHLATGTWDERVRTRNQRLQVDEARWDDASAAYATPAYEAATEAWRRDLRDFADGRSVVGVALFDARGLFFVRLETDAPRFESAWPALLAASALDSLMREGPRDAWPEHEGQMRAEVRGALAALAAGPGQSRPTFGLGMEHRFALPDGTGAWEGLSLEGRPVALTLLREPAPRPDRTPPPPPQPPEGTTPVPGVIDRDPRPSPFEERWRERREDLGQGGVRR